MSRSIPPILSAVRASPWLRPWRGFGVVRLVSLLLFVLSTGGPAAIAQDDSNASYWLQQRARDSETRPPEQQPRVVQRPTHLIRGAAPVRGFAREVPVKAPPPAGGPVAPVEGTVTAAPETPAPEAGSPAAATTTASPRPASATFVVAVMGDSLGQLLAQGLSEAFADKPEVVILRKARENSGLVRDDYFDWVKAARDLVAGPDKIDVAVMMIGSNDRQQIRDGVGTAELHMSRWKELYAGRVEAIADLFRDKKIPLIWVGLPIMKSDRLSADMADFNEIYRDSAGKAGAIYIDTWEAFADDRGQYSAYGPDVTGQFVKIRAGDGVHFTQAGARTLAHFVEDDIRRDEQQALPPLDPAVAALEPHAAAAPPSGQPSRPQALDGLAGLPVPAPPPAVVIPVEPAAGPIVPLNAPAVSPDGQLATLTNATATSSDAQTLLDRALVEGRPLEARPGRTDDFSWPRQ
jgi:hypothetical protein